MPYGFRGDDSEIVDGCLRGEAKWQKILFEKYYGKMLAVCQRYSKNRDEAKDILQDGYIKVFQKLDQFNRNSTLDAWIRRVMVNTAIDYYRKTSSTPVMQEMDEAGAISGQHDVISDLNHAALLDVLQQLPPGYKMVFNMYVIEGYSHKEIAEMLHISEGTSKSQLGKAKIYLQKLLGKKASAYND